MMAASVIGWTGWASHAQEPALPPPLPPWDRVITLRAGPGYKDNVTLSALAPEASAFVKSGFDALFTRLPGRGPAIDLFVGFDDVHYFSSPTVDKEQLGFVQGEVRSDWGEVWEASLGLEYLYLDQVLDVSVTETNLQAVQVLGHTFVGRPGVRLNLSPQVWFGTEFYVGRYFVNEPLDDYWEIGPRVNAGFSYGYLSELSLSYESSLRTYDEDEQLTSEGVPIPGTQRAFEQQEVRLTWRHHWDKERRWRTTTRVLYKVNDDNGGGFFDYKKYQGAVGLRYRGAGWEASGEARLSHYDYDVQAVSATDPATRRRNEVLLNLRGEKTLYQNLKLFAEYEREQILSNLFLEEYTVNVVNGGVSWEF